MRTIVEPKEHIDKLWGKQRIRDGDTYRMMRYVLRVDHDGKVLLHNVVTGRLVVLDQDEAKAIEKLPTAYSPEMEQLVTEHYLVPEDYDEHQQVINLRTILQKLDDAQQSKDIIHYTILPTTACNARCYYCFEHGVKPITMSEKTAQDLVAFIISHCGEAKTIQITWFGGEPTVAEVRIDQICDGLRQNGIHFISKMITNGYLFDSEMVAKAKERWNLKALQICVDGTEISYNAIKSYVSASDNPYQRVMRNIGLLLEQGVAVGLRMNYDLGNYQEFNDLIDEVRNRYGHHELLHLSAHPVIGSYKDHNGVVLHADDTWFNQKNAELFDLASRNGFYHNLRQFPFLNGDACSAYYDYSLTVRPDGGISRCAELFGDNDLIGSLNRGIDNQAVSCSWKIVADYEMCRNCNLFPYCVRLVNCPNKTYCHKLSVYHLQFEETVKRLMEKGIHRTIEKGEEYDDDEGT